MIMNKVKKSAKMKDLNIESTPDLELSSLQINGVKSAISPRPSNLDKSSKASQMEEDEVFADNNNSVVIGEKDRERFVKRCNSQPEDDLAIVLRPSSSTPTLQQLRESPLPARATSRRARCKCRSYAEHALEHGNAAVGACCGGSDPSAEYLARRSLSPWRMVKDPVQPRTGSLQRGRRRDGSRGAGAGGDVTEEDEDEEADEFPSFLSPLPSSRPRANTLPDKLGGSEWRRARGRGPAGRDRPPSPVSPRHGLGGGLASGGRTWSREVIAEPGLPEVQEV